MSAQMLLANDVLQRTCSRFLVQLYMLVLQRSRTRPHQRRNGSQIAPSKRGETIAEALKSTGIRKIGKGN
jgi:hypothetical protein